MRRVFEAETYTVGIRIRPDQIVQSAFIDFPGLLFELGILTQKTQKISIKIYVDTHPRRVLLRRSLLFASTLF